MATYEARHQPDGSEVASSRATSTTRYQSASSSPNRARRQAHPEYVCRVWRKEHDGWYYPIDRTRKFVPGHGTVSRLREQDVIKQGFQIESQDNLATRAHELNPAAANGTISMHPPPSFREHLEPSASSGPGNAHMPPIGTPHGQTAQDNAAGGNGSTSHPAASRRENDSRPNATGESDPNERRKMSGFMQNVSQAATSSPSPSEQASQMNGMTQMALHHRSASNSSFELTAGLRNSVHASSDENPQTHSTRFPSSTPLLTPPRSPSNHEHEASPKPQYNGPAKIPEVVFLDEGSMPSACPSGKDPNPTGKVYCTYYLRNGMCDYQQRNCQYRHFFPPTWDGMRAIGFLTIPEWLAHVYPPAYAELKRQLGPCPWGIPGAGSAKGRADVSREHHANFQRDHGYNSGDRGYGNQGYPNQRYGNQAYGNEGYARFSGPRGNYANFNGNAGRGGPQNYRKGNTYAPDRGAPRQSQRQQYPMVNQWVETAASGPAAGDDDVQSTTASTDMIKFSSAAPSVAGSTASKKRRGKNRRSSLVSESSGPTDIFTAAAMEKNAAEVAAIERRNAEMAKQGGSPPAASASPSLSGNDDSTPSSPAASTSSGLQAPIMPKSTTPANGSYRLLEQVAANAKSNERTHAASEKAQAAAVKAAADKAAAASPANTKQTQHAGGKNKQVRNNSAPAHKVAADKGSQGKKAAAAEAAQAMLALKEKEIELLRKEADLTMREAALEESQASSSGRANRRGRGRSGNKKPAKQNGRNNGNKTATAGKKAADTAKPATAPTSGASGSQSSPGAASVDKKEQATSGKAAPNTPSGSSTSSVPVARSVASASPSGAPGAAVTASPT